MADVQIYANLWMAATSAALVTFAGAWALRLRQSLTGRSAPQPSAEELPIEPGQLVLELSANGRIERVRGRLAGELDPCGLELCSFVAPEDQAALAEALERLRPGAAETSLELRAHLGAGDGAAGWQRWLLRAQFRRARVQGYTCVTRDVAREKELEHKLASQQIVLERMERALLKERELCGEIVAACPAFLVLLDAEDRIVRVNRSMWETLDYEEHELIGCNFWAALAPDVAHAERSFALQEPLGGLATELRLRSAQRRVHLVDWRWRVVRDAQGQRSLRLGVGIDVTERRRQEDWLTTQHQQLVEADRMLALGTLISSLAHEISNPNQVIQINVPLLEEAWGSLTSEPLAQPVSETLYREVPQMLQEVLAASDRIQFIVRELKAHRRGETQWAMSAIDVNEVVKSGLTLIASTLRRATRRFSVNYAESLPPVAGNLRRLEQVMINLLLNACQALSDPQQALHVETWHDTRKGEVILAVKDEGVGIRREDLARILDPFFTTKRQQGGTGLGLAIARHIAERHGGRIELESELGKGTLARLHLPVLPDPGATRPRR